MFRELDDYLSGYMSLDYWYDEGFDFARRILHLFSKNDWDRLKEALDTKEDEWKLKLAYIIDSGCGKEGISILASMLATDNTELVETVLDSIRTYGNIDWYTGNISFKELIMEQIEKLKCNNSLSKPVQIMIKDLADKINESEGYD